MILSWLFCRVPGLSSCFSSSGSVHLNHHHNEEQPPEPPLSATECWKTIEDVHSESQYRWTMGQGATLEDKKNEIYDALYILVRHHELTLEKVNETIRERRLFYVWLYPLRHPGDSDPECATLCRDPLTHELKTHSVGVFLGPESEFVLVRQATRGSSLSECGFLELK